MSAVKEIPDSLLSKYTMDGKASVYQWWFDDSNKDVSENYTIPVIESCKDRIRNKQTGYYFQTDTWLYKALELFPIRGKTVLVFGSECP